MKGTPSAPHVALVCSSGVEGFFHDVTFVYMYILPVVAYGDTPGTKFAGRRPFEPIMPTSRTYLTSGFAGSGFACKFLMISQFEARFVSHLGPATALGLSPPPVPLGG